MTGKQRLNRKIGTENVRRIPRFWCGRGCAYRGPSEALDALPRVRVYSTNGGHLVTFFTV